MGDERDAIRRQRITDEHPDLPDDVIDGLVKAQKLNERLDGFVEDVDADYWADGPSP